MKKKIFIFVVMAAFLITASAFAELARIHISQTENALTGAEPLPNVPAYPYNPGLITQSPGIMMGTTWYDYQTNGSTGNRVAITDSNTIYVDWMNGLTYPPPPRQIFQNWRDASGNWNHVMGCKVDERPANTGLAGYTNLDIYQGYRGAIAYHCSDATPSLARLAVDDADYPGWCYFARFNIPNMYAGLEHVWPYITVDRNDRTHILMTYPAPEAGDPHDFIYVRSADAGSSWTRSVVVDTTMTISAVIDASPVSDKVIIAYTHPTTFDNQWENDVYYILSLDGIEWPFLTGKMNVTNYLQDDDSLWAYTDMDVIFDYNDDFHLIWNAQTIDTEGYIQWNTRLFHYNSATEEINRIHMWPLTDYWIDGCACGAWNRPISKMNLGVHPSNALFATWTQFDTLDCSFGGGANGEIYMSYTLDGTGWVGPVNLTNSHTPGCFPEECDSDHWSTLADVVTDTIINGSTHPYLHITYINDKDAGGVPQEPDPGVATENPVMYLAHPVRDIDAIDEEVNRPANFSLNQNYPNPFNAKTSISFELKEASPVMIEVFDITGAKVTTLVNEFMSVGPHSVTWNAEGVASGIYYYRMKAGATSETKQAVLIK